MTLSNRPTVSVVIPTYNRDFCIVQTLETVFNQTYTDYEVIVVDDGSTDNTSQLINGRYKEKVKYIYQSNAGVSIARNTGIQAAQGDWIAFLDSDDEWLPEKLRYQMEDLGANTGAVAHMVDVLISGSEKTMFELRGLRVEFERQPFRERPLCEVLKSTFFPSSWVVSRNAIQAAGYFNTSMRIFEDTDLLSRVALEGAFLVNCYVGTNIRRKPGDSGALSDLYQTARQESLSNIITMYKNLILSKKTTKKEIIYIEKELAANYLELAIAQGKYKKNICYYSTLAASLKCDHTFFGLAKVLILLILGVRGFEVLRRIKNIDQKELRRSSLEG